MQDVIISTVLYTDVRTLPKLFLLFITLQQQRISNSITHRLFQSINTHLFTVIHFSTFREQKFYHLRMIIIMC